MSLVKDFTIEIFPKAPQMSSIEQMNDNILIETKMISFANKTKTIDKSTNVTLFFDLL